MTAEEIYGACSSQQDPLLCVTQYAVKQDEMNREYTRGIAVIFCAALVFFMQAGFAMLCAGAVRTKNVQNTMLKNLLDACGASIAFFAFGYAFAFGDGSSPNAFIGTTTNFFLMGLEL